MRLFSFGPASRAAGVLVLAGAWEIYRNGERATGSKCLAALATGKEISLMSPTRRLDRSAAFSLLRGV